MVRLGSKIIAFFVCVALGACTGGVALAAKSTEAVSTDKTQSELKSADTSTDSSSFSTTSSQVKSSGDVLVIDKKNQRDDKIDQSTINNVDNYSTNSISPVTIPAVASPDNSHTKLIPEQNIKLPIQNIEPRSSRIVSKTPTIIDSNYTNTSRNNQTSSVLSTPASPPVPTPQPYPHSGLVLDSLLHMGMTVVLPNTGMTLFQHLHALKLSDYELVAVLLAYLSILVLSVVILNWKKNHYRGAPRSDIAALYSAVDYKDLFNIGALFRGELLLFCQRRVE